MINLDDLRQPEGYFAKTFRDLSFQSNLLSTEVNRNWITLVHRVGSLLPRSGLVLQVNSLSHIDLLLRGLERDHAIEIHRGEATLFFALSEGWIISAYEIFRLLQDASRNIVMREGEFAAILHDLELIRIPLAKQELAKDKKMTEPMEFVRMPAREGDTPEIYDKSDASKGVLLPTALGYNGSQEWCVVDVVSKTSKWLNRQELSDRIISFWLSYSPR